MTGPPLSPPRRFLSVPTLFQRFLGLFSRSEDKPRSGQMLLWGLRGVFGAVASSAQLIEVL